MRLSARRLACDGEELRILGIDPGSHTTGYGVVEKAGGRLVHICDGEISADVKLPLSERLFVISKALNEVIEAQSPEAVSVESIFFAKNVKSAVMLGHARGVCMLGAARFGLPVFEYAPMSIKKAVTGFGAATKEQVQKMVVALLSCPAPSGADASDALAIAICHINHCRPGVPVARGGRRPVTTDTGR
ncbi:MAG: crossover junction endodeoxyribonuclease RuvC [Thermodesulfobacteriota bacterium]|nr:MAG: crossover junction endodeoxyribonuclease RuvC [Thermodesulfobacteriota bacterium]